MEKKIEFFRGRILTLFIVLLVILLFVFAFFVLENKKTVKPTPVNDSQNTTECNSDSGCVPRDCCHSSACVPASQKKVCNLLCTAECAPNTLDCQQGECKCINGKCGAVFR